ncbi:sulfatase family protein [Paenibacillus chungangensis]|uniref:Arylsulfatase n=1 Tax=Paenibacillus chungangensis TaxID=696535 RepID=A0ABW3HSN9_9BACL
MSKPNMIYIITDDLGYGDLSCYGATQFQTPNLDKLAEQGRLYRDAHASSAVCTPSRYGVMTGRYCWRGKIQSGVLHGHDGTLMEEGRMTVPSYLRDNGYVTACIGKWHLGMDWERIGPAVSDVDYSKPIQNGPLSFGFDYYYGISASLDMPPYCFIENDRTVGIPSEPKDPEDFSQRGRGGLMVPGWRDEDVHPVLAGKALQFIAESSGGDRPFFLYLPLTGPHTPWSPSEAFKGKSGIGPRADLILEIDDTIGQMMKLLEERGIADNTIIAFTSDNGADPFREEITVHGHDPSGGLRGQKADIWEGGHRVPLIVSWPAKVRPGTISDELVCLTDWLATCASIIGVPLPDDAGEDSIDMLPDLTAEEGTRPIRESVILQAYDGMLGLRKGDWKYVRGAGGGGFDQSKRTIIGIPHTSDREILPGDPAEQLYRMSSDRSESSNVSMEQPQLISELRGELETMIEAGRTRAKSGEQLS